MIVAPLNPETPQAQALLDRSDQYMAALYPCGSNHLLSGQELARADTFFFGVSIAQELVGCGAVRILANDGVYGEIKRVFILNEHRGQGLSRKLMLRLEAHLKERDIKIARLETGVKQPEAIGLYTSLGYQRRGPFGTYDHDPLSVFMEKRLAG